MRRKTQSVESQAKVRKELAKYKGPAGLLPWNWAKKAEYASQQLMSCVHIYQIYSLIALRWNAKLKRLDVQSETVARNYLSGPSDDEIASFRFPEPTMAKAHVACTHPKHSLAHSGLSVRFFSSLQGHRYAAYYAGGERLRRRVAACREFDAKLLRTPNHSLPPVRVLPQAVAEDIGGRNGAGGGHYSGR